MINAKCRHDWRIENTVTHLPEGTLIHAIVRCGYCKLVKEPVKAEEFAIQGKPVEHRHDSTGRCTIGDPPKNPNLSVDIGD